MSALDESGKIEYHYGFYGAVHAEYEPTHIQMEYLQEHELGDEPVRMDMLVIKRDTAALTDPIGAFFRTHNVLEYKSPEDALTIDDFYKAQGYALIYKSMGQSVNAIPLTELTVSVFRHSFPRKLFQTLEETGLTVREEFPGIYRVAGALSVATQVVVISRLPRGHYSAFKALAKGVEKEDILRLLSLAQTGDARMVDYVRAVLRICIPINRDTIARIKEDDVMKQTAFEEAFYQIFGDELQKERENGLKEGREEGRKEVYERLKREGMSEERAHALAFG